VIYIIVEKNPQNPFETLWMNDVM